MERNARAIKEAYGQRARDYILAGLGQKEVGGKILCPFHNDRRPSMSWFSNGLMWRCHACQEQIDIYRYLMEYENLTFTQAMDKVAEMAGVLHKTIQQSAKKYMLPNIETYDLSQKAIDYMAQRKITKETLDVWKVRERI